MITSSLISQYAVKEQFDPIFAPRLTIQNGLLLFRHQFQHHPQLAKGCIVTLFPIFAFSEIISNYMC